MAYNASVFSFFAGAGFLDSGFETTEGYNIVFVNEVHEPFLHTYKHSREHLGLDEPVYGYYQGDITDFIQHKKSELTYLINAERLKNNIIGFIGGPPCPDFSVGGKNRGKEGENGKLTETYVELICQHNPDFFLLENVKGLWRTKKHRAFYDEMKFRLHCCGYITAERLINTLEYGVPQQRERIILLGFKKDFIDDIGLILPNEEKELSTQFFPWSKEIKYNVKELMELPWPTESPFKENSKLEPPSGIPLELTVEYWFRKNDVENHPNSKQHFKPKAGLAKFKTVQEGDDSKKSYKRLHRWRYSPTAAYGNNEVHLHPYKARRISVSEALAIQSLPKKFQLPDGITLSNAFKTVGNGVPYLASKGIAKTIFNFLEGASYETNSLKYSYSYK